MCLPTGRWTFTPAVSSPRRPPEPCPLLPSVLGEPSLTPTAGPTPAEQVGHRTPAHSSVLSSPVIPQPQQSPRGWGRKDIVDEPEFSEGARLLAAAGAIPAAHHALVKLFFGANDAVTASMDAAALDADRGAVGGTGRPVHHLETREGKTRRVAARPGGGGKPNKTHIPPGRGCGRNGERAGNSARDDKQDAKD